MSDYVLTTNNELYHYGVKGMKWGVRRYQKKLSKSTSDTDTNRALSKLQKHRAKGSAELSKLKKKHDKLEVDLAGSSQKDAEKAIQLERKASKLDRKAAKKRKKAGSILTSAKKATKLTYQADYLKSRSDILKSKASTMKATYERNKQKVEGNERMQKLFQMEINKIDATFAQYGKDYRDKLD